MELIPLNQELKEKIYQWNLDPEMRRNMGAPSVALGERQFNAFLDSINDDIKNFTYGIKTKKSEVIGMFSLENLDLRSKRAFFHLAFDSGYWHLVNKATKRFFDYVFIENGLRQLNMVVLKSHEHVHKFARKVGFKQNCILKDYLFSQTGFEDACFYSLLKENRKI